MDLETRIGTLWLRRVGLVVLVIGVVFFGNYIHRNLHPWVKVAACYALAIGLAGLGTFLERGLQGFGRALTAGGLAIAFFTSYAAHFFPPMACMGLVPSLGLMSLSVVAILFAAERWKSEPAAMLAIFLGHAASFVASGEADVFSVVAILFLSAAGMALFLRHHWLPLNLFTVVAAFGSHFVWTLRADPTGSTPEQKLRIQLIFLTAYYALFLASDLIHRLRVPETRTQTLGKAALIARRAVGPIALILYATLSAVYFHVTAVHWDSIHLWLFPLAAIQVGVVVFHIRTGSRDWPFHAAACATFATLGLFSWFDGLALNLMLAAEALLLLVLAQRLRLPFLAPLAQAVLVVHFVQYWNVEEIRRWPEYLGALATASIYFVKSRIEAHWTPASAGEAPEGPLARNLRTAFDLLAPPLAWVHALLGAIIAVTATWKFGDVVWTPPLLASLAALAVASVIALRHEPMILAVLTIQAAAVMSLVQLQFSSGEWTPRAIETDDWPIAQASAAILSVVSMALIARARVLGKAFGVAAASCALASLSALVANSLRPDPSWRYLCLLPPIACWASAALASPRSARAATIPIPWQRLAPGLAAAVCGICGSILFAGALWQSLGSQNRAILAACLATPIFLGLVIGTGWARLLPALLVHLAATAIQLLSALLSDRSPGEPLAWGVIAGTAACAVALQLAGGPRVRGAFVNAGGAALLMALLGSWLLIELTGVTRFFVPPAAARFSPARLDFAPLAPWLVCAALFWIAIEVLRARARLLPRRENVATTILGVAASAVLLGFTLRRFDAGGNAAAASAAYALVLLVLAPLLRSIPLGVGAAVTLGAAHILLLVVYEDLGPALAFIHPVASAFVALVAMAAGALSEKLWRSGTIAGTEADKVAAALAWIPYAASLFLGGWLLGEWGSAALGSPGLEPPCRAAFWLLAAAVGRLLSLPWLALAGLAYGMGAAALLAENAAFDLAPPEGLLRAGVLLAAEVIVLERLLPRKRGTRTSSQIEGIARIAAVVASAVLLLAAITKAEELQGYWTTVGWSLVALVYAGFGFLWGEVAYRRAGLVVFGVTLLRVVLVDLAELELFYRMLAFLGLGASLLIVSFLYSRAKSRAGIRS